MTMLVITRGLPASGKTTFAREWVAEDREHRVRVNRDDLRLMVDDGEFKHGITEKRILTARNFLVEHFLAAGYDVVVDDTNLPAYTVRDLTSIARRRRAPVQYHDLRQVPLETCLKRNAARAFPIPEDDIRRMHNTYIAE